MRRNGLAVIASILLTCGSAAFAQANPPAADRSDKTDRKADVTYGRIKEITPAKVVIDVANRPDKSFDLTDKDKTYHVASGLKVGDSAMVSERKINGKQVVNIAHHSGGGVKHGGKNREEEIEQAPKK